MKMQEFIESIEQAEADTDNFYAKRTQLHHLYSDVRESIADGYMEGVSVFKPKDGTMKADCEDGFVSIVTNGCKLHFSKNPYLESKRRSFGGVTGNGAGHYERTCAAVYATGNKWAIENFEATH